NQKMLKTNIHAGPGWKKKRAANRIRPASFFGKIPKKGKKPKPLLARPTGLAQQRAAQRKPAGRARRATRQAGPSDGAGSGAARADRWGGPDRPAAQRGMGEASARCGRDTGAVQA